MIRKLNTLKDIQRHLQFARMRSLALVLLLILASACSSSDTTDPAPSSDVAENTSPDTTDTTSEEINDSPDTAAPLDFKEPEPTMVITDVVADSGHTAGGETVAVIGTGFTKGSKVLFDGSAADNVLFITEERLHADTPPPLSRPSLCTCRQFEQRNSRTGRGLPILQRGAC